MENVAFAKHLNKEQSTLELILVSSISGPILKSSLTISSAMQNAAMAQLPH